MNKLKTKGKDAFVVTIILSTKLKYALPSVVVEQMHVSNKQQNMVEQRGYKFNSRDYGTTVPEGGGVSFIKTNVTLPNIKKNC